MFLEVNIYVFTFHPPSFKKTFIFFYITQKTFIFKTFTNYYQAMSILAVQIKLHIVKV